MALTVTHPFVSAIPDGPDATQVRPSNWNANHTLTGSISVGEVTGVTDRQIVFGSASNLGTSSANFTFDNNNSGAFVLRMGDGATQTQIQAKSPNLTGDGPQFLFSGASSGSVSGKGGETIFNGGNGSSLAGGNFSLNAGQGYTSGGLCILNGGIGVTTSGGSILGRSGDGGTNGGGIQWTGGDGYNGNGGSFEVFAGSAVGASGNAGNIAFTCGFIATQGNGGSIEATATDGVGLNAAGGSINLTMGVRTGTGTVGRLKITNSFGSYATAPSVGVVTAALGPGVGVTLTKWVPVVVDGTDGWFPFYS